MTKAVARRRPNGNRRKPRLVRSALGVVLWIQNANHGDIPVLFVTVHPVPDYELVLALEPTPIDIHFALPPFCQLAKKRHDLDRSAVLTLEMFRKPLQGGARIDQIFADQDM